MPYRQLRFYATWALHALTQRQSLFVLSYPASGSSWLSRMAATALRLPYYKPKGIWAPRVIHMHRFFSPPLIRARTIYIVRDVRDCFLSYAGMLTQGLAQGQIDERVLWRRYGVVPDALQPDAADFRTFTRRLMNTRQTSVNWLTHVQRASHLKLCTTRYEDLWSDPGAALAEVIGCTGRSLELKAEHVASLHHIQQERDAINVVRKGGIEKWRNYSSQPWVQEVTDWACTGLRLHGYPTHTG